MKEYIEKCLRRTIIIEHKLFDKNLLKAYGLDNGDVVARLKQLYL